MSVVGPTQGATPGLADRWHSRPILAQCLRALIFALPFVVSAAVATLVAAIAPPIDSNRVLIGWWAVLLIVALSTLVLLDRFMRQFIPLVALLRLSLIFPDQAPNRFSVALRSRTTRSVARRLEEMRVGGADLMDRDSSYAVQMLELVAMLGVHDRLTRGHSERVRAYTDLIMEEMGLSTEDADRLRWAALLHDVGKLVVPAEILNKAAMPDTVDWEILKGHAAEGQRIVEPIAAWLGDWVRTVGEHHERWDGNGYPNGLAGNDIHLGARIVAVADTFDVITSARSYKKPIPMADARAEIVRNAGTQFDPQVVRAFLSIGIGPLRFVAGPVAWLSSLFALSPAPVGGAGTVAAAAFTVASVGGLAIPTELLTVQRPTELGYNAAAASTIEDEGTVTTVFVDESDGAEPAGQATPPTIQVNRPLNNDAGPTMTSSASVSSTTAAPGSNAPIGSIPVATVPTTTVPAPTTTSSSVASTTTTTVVASTLPPPLQLASARFTTPAVSDDGDAIGALAVNDPAASIQWTAQGSTVPFAVTDSGAIVLSDADALLELDMYGSSMTLDVVGAADDGRTVYGAVQIDVEALSSSNSGLIISEFAPSSAASSNAFVEVLNSSNEARLVSRVQLSTRGYQNVDDRFDQPFVLLPGEVFLISTGTGPSGVRTLTLPDTSRLRWESNSSEIAVRLSISADPAADLSDPANWVDSFATDSTDESVADGFGEGDLASSPPSASVSFHRLGAGGICQDTNNNRSDFQMSIAGFGQPASPGVPGCAPRTTVTQVAATNVVISEINTRGEGEHTEFIELLNPTATAISLTGWTLSSVDNNGIAAFSISLDSLGTIAPGQRLLIVDRYWATPVTTPGYDDTGTHDLRMVVGNDIRRGTFTLTTSGGSIADQVAVGVGGALPADSHGTSSWVRRYDGYHNTGNLRNDFVYVAVGDPSGSSLG